MCTPLPASCTHHLRLPPLKDPWAQVAYSATAQLPGSLLTTAVDSIIGTNQEFSTLGSQAMMGHHHYFSGDSSSLTSESTCRVNPNASPDPKNSKGVSTAGLQKSYGLNEIGTSGSDEGGGVGSSSSSLVRHSSLPAGFLNHLTSDNAGFSLTRGTGSYNYQVGGSSGGHGISRLKPQLSFTRQDSPLSQISEVSENVVDGIDSNNGHRDGSHSYAPNSFAMESWDNTNSIVFSGPPCKRTKNINGDILNCLNGIESQLSLPQTTLEMATVEKLLHIPEDSVPCKIRARRGFATHPRSIAERERRTRISGKLKKLQDLVPNMDKQTSYADMLDLAVQHIKGLQNHVQVGKKHAMMKGGKIKRVSFIFHTVWVTSILLNNQGADMVSSPIEIIFPRLWSLHQHPPNQITPTQYQRLGLRYTKSVLVYLNYIIIMILLIFSSRSNGIPES
ncbi:hypothetical protein L1049_016110 [Liquidambar formosana]|uniref:BHLH domain-containing protein n=1 Tax=Liquidambar formosana TaxID=63359 RepID=A0AAP0S5Q0_LIQFO